MPNARYARRNLVDIAPIPSTTTTTPGASVGCSVHHATRALGHSVIQRAYYQLQSRICVSYDVCSPNPHIGNNPLWGCERNQLVSHEPASKLWADCCVAVEDIETARQDIVVNIVLSNNTYAQPVLLRPTSHIDATRHHQVGSREGKSVRMKRDAIACRCAGCSGEGECVAGRW